MRRKMISKASLARRCRGLGFFIFILKEMQVRAEEEPERI